LFIGSVPGFPHTSPGRCSMPTRPSRGFSQHTIGALDNAMEYHPITDLEIYAPKVEKNYLFSARIIG
jgi:hypothetical protein